MGGSYRNTFQRECFTNASKCPWFPSSWDAYMFRAPLPAFPLRLVNFTMNNLGAENRAAFQLWNAGLKLYNPCVHIQAYHWHCVGEKMHSNATRVDKRDLHNAAEILPCFNCRGVQSPGISKGPFCEAGELTKMDGCVQPCDKIGSERRRTVPMK